MTTPVGRRGVRLQRVVVRRRDDDRAAPPEVVDDGGAERAAFDRVGAAADFVEQHERRQLERAIHGDEVGDVRGERAEAGRDRLVVADVGEDRLERRERAAVLDRNSRPACAISASRPKALSATVLPPVFGPEITSARAGGAIDEVGGDGRDASTGSDIRDPISSAMSVPAPPESAADDGRRGTRAGRRL